MTPLYTIGIGTREVPDLLRDLQAHGVHYLIDVRSRPYSAHKPAFNREPLRDACQEARVVYAHWPALGGFPSDESVLRDGQVDYALLAAQPVFQDYLHRLREGLADGQTIAILCSEGRPETCHRSKCIGVELEQAGVELRHIDPDGTLASQEEVIGRLTRDQFSLPGLEPPQRSKRRWEGPDGAA